MEEGMADPATAGGMDDGVEEAMGGTAPVSTSGGHGGEANGGHGGTKEDGEGAG